LVKDVETLLGVVIVSVTGVLTLFVSGGKENGCENTHECCGPKVFPSICHVYVLYVLSEAEANCSAREGHPLKCTVKLVGWTYVESYCMLALFQWKSTMWNSGDPLLAPKRCSVDQSNPFVGGTNGTGGGGGGGSKLPGAIAIPSGSIRPWIVATTVSVAVAITSTLPRPRSVTYRYVPSGISAMPLGLLPDPSEMTEPTRLVVVLITETVPSVPLVT